MSIFLDYLLQGMGSLALLAASVAAFVYLPPPWGPRVAAAAGAAFVALLAYTAGYHAMHLRCLEASASFQSQISARDQKIEDSQSTLAETLDRTRATITQKDRQLAEYTLKPSGACPLSPADRDWLRAIR